MFWTVRRNGIAKDEVRNVPFASRSKTLDTTFSPAGSSVSSPVSNHLPEAGVTPRCVENVPAAAPLPVTFLGLVANRADNGVNLRWDVAEESNVREYQLEKSSDGSSFATVGSVSPSPRFDTCPASFWSMVADVL